MQEYATPGMIRWAVALGLKYDRQTARQLLDELDEAVKTADDRLVAGLRSLPQGEYNDLPEVLQSRTKELRAQVRAARFRLRGIQEGARVQLREGPTTYIVEKLSLRGNSTLRPVGGGEARRPGPQTLMKAIVVE